MKNYIFTLVALLAFSFAGQAQEGKTVQKTTKTTVQTKNTDKVVHRSTDKVVLKKDGTPDKRYKSSQKLKKDGTPDMRYKENKVVTKTKVVEKK